MHFKSTLMETNRRNFIRRMAILGMGGSVLGLHSCKLAEIDPFSLYYIREADCLACGKCADVCRYNAVDVVKKSAFAIDPALCSSCGKCTGGCEDDAIHVPAINYSIISDECTSCGDS